MNLDSTNKKGFVKRFMVKTARVLFFIGVFPVISACAGTLIGGAVDVTLEVAKVPFKVAGAVVDVVTPDDD